MRIRNFLLPKSLKRELPSTFRLFVSVTPVLVVVWSIMAFLLFHLGSVLAGLSMAAWCVSATIALLLVPLGWFDTSRYVYFGSSVVLLVVEDQFMGIHSFFWVYLVNMMAAVPVLVGSSEIRVQRFIYWSCSLGLFFVVLLHWGGWLPVDVPPTFDPVISYLGAFNVASCLILQGVAIKGIRDDTERFRRTIETQSSAMMQQARMSSLGEMSAGVAHEINNPLTVILGKVTSLRRNLTSPTMDLPRALTDLERLEVVVSRIANIVSGLLTFSRNDKAETFRQSTLRAILDETLLFSNETLRAKQIQLEISGDLDVEFNCHPQRISQVLFNLINNASDAVSSLSEKWIRIEAVVKKKNTLCIFVTDSGPGIPKEIAEKIMQPFFTTKELGKGTGLGLSISRGIVEEHGGTLSLIPGVHTRFAVELPLFSK